MDPSVWRTFWNALVLTLVEVFKLQANLASRTFAV